VRIGIDIDNVISNFNEMLLETYLIHDKELRNTGIINPNAKYIRTGMFDWSNEEELSFYKDNIEGIAKKLKVKEKAKEYIDRLHSDGHLIYIITGRDNGEYSEPYNMTKKWLDENNIYYDNLILTDAYDIHAKSLECLKNDIDIMIDDSVRICSDLITSGITTILMDTPYNRKINIKRVKNWEEFYEFVSSYKENK
jgi:uncharacterized HAD superfamily protein